MTPAQPQGVRAVRATDPEPLGHERPGPQPATPRRRWLGVVALLALLAFNGVGAFPLHEPDEGRYADVAAAMVRDGDWLTPRLSGIDYYEKPALHFWCVGASLALFGHSEGPARLSTSLAFLLTALLVGAWAGRIGGEPAGSSPSARPGRPFGWQAAAVFVTLPLAGFFAHIILVDTTLTLFTTCCLFASYRGLIEPEPDAPPRRRWILLAWGAAGLAMLTKGPIGVVLPFGAVGGTLLLTRSWGRIGALLRPDGPLVFLAVCGPWFAWMCAEHPNYARAFFLEQNLARATTGGKFERDGALWYYLPVLLVGFLPWVALLPRIVQRTRASGARPTDLAGRTRLFLACAVVVPLVILSLAGSKLVYYVLPLAPPFALLATDALLVDAQPSPRARRWGGAALLGLGALVVLAALVAIPGIWIEVETLRGWFGRSHLSPQKLELELTRLGAIRAALPVAIPAAVLIGAGLALAGVALRGGQRLRAFAALGGCVLLAQLVTPYVMGLAGPAYSNRQLARAIEAHAGATGPVVCFGTFRRCVPFYLDRPVYLWEANYSEFGHDLAPGECEFALQDDEAALGALIREHPRVVLLAKNEAAIDALRALSPLPLRVLAHMGGRVLLVRADAP
ncbi:MAG: glycosyltransferase family 39 protein [Planctomycetes bacterium]|nr:glycosyltransferase family 39 protein [Planctomycetota bacterium]